MKSRTRTWLSWKPQSTREIHPEERLHNDSHFAVPLFRLRVLPCARQLFSLPHPIISLFPDVVLAVATHPLCWRILQPSPSRWGLKHGVVETCSLQSDASDLKVGCGSSPAWPSHRFFSHEKLKPHSKLRPSLANFNSLGGFHSSGNQRAFLLPYLGETSPSNGYPQQYVASTQSIHFGWTEMICRSSHL